MLRLASSICFRKSSPCNDPRFRNTSSGERNSKDKENAKEEMAEKVKAREDATINSLAV
jgi:hypothetical protein